MSTGAIPKPAGQNAARVLKPEHLPSLDGLRAISICLVLLGHLSGTQNLGYLLPGLGDIAHLGVVVFFVISGFLITTLLIKEHAKTGRVSLKLFYARRALRIFPASYAFLACVSALWFMGLLHCMPVIAGTP
jgi:peptidoglycan/LPS O-acetylase OafA/YrhL